MIGKIWQARKSVLVQGSAVVFIGSLATGLGNYFYNIVMGRMLGAADFGILASLVSLSYIVTVPSGTIDLVAAHYVSRFRAHNQMGQVVSFIAAASRYSLTFGLVFFAIFAAASPWLSAYLKISSVWPVLILGIVFFATFVMPVNRGGLRGLQKFRQLTSNSVILVALKIGFAVALVAVGFRIGGALVALAIAALLSNIHAVMALKLPRERSPLDLSWKKIIAYAAPAFLVSLAIALLYNMDVVLAKHFLGDMEAGYYAVLSLTGKIIFFATGAVATVLFPLVTAAHAHREPHYHLLVKANLLITAVSLVICAGYFIAPHWIVVTMFGSQYAPVAPYLGWFGLAIFLFSIINTLAMYYLSFGCQKFLPFLIAGAVLQVILIYLFHQSIWQIVFSMLAVMVIILGSFALYRGGHKLGGIIYNKTS